jgi:hypothetical protein
VRDFSPEGGGRRAAAAPLVEPNAYSGNPPGASDLDYRTQAAPTPYVPPAPVAEPTTHQTQSRRQIRQREMDAEAAATTTGSAAYGIPRQDAPPPSVVTAPPSLQTAPPPPPQSLQTAPPPTQQGQPSTHSNGTTEFDALTRNGQLAPPNANQRVSDPSTPAFQQPDLAPEVEQTGGWVAPAGHWSRQADLDDETQPWENTITREVGGGNVATTTSALVLPEIPRADPFATALNSTGEVLLTGSIDLPRSLGSTGTDSRHYDDPSVDRMFDTQDAEFTGTDSAPVRAIRAVSTHNSARGVIHANKPHGNRLIVVVFVATAVLAVGVVGMLIASLAFGLF